MTAEQRARIDGARRRIEQLALEVRELLVEHAAAHPRPGHVGSALTRAASHLASAAEELRKAMTLSRALERKVRKEETSRPQQ